MVPTVAQITADALGCLDDDNGIRFPAPIQTWGWNRAYLTLIDCFVLLEVPQVQKKALWVLPALTTSLTPAAAGITDFGELLQLEERLNGSTDTYTEVQEVDDLEDMPQTDTLSQFVWETGFGTVPQFNFVGATTIRQLRISFYGSGTPPVSGTVGIDQSLLVLSKLMAGFMAPRKGDPELGDRLIKEAVGDAFNRGVVGGDAYRLIQPMVRGRQRVPVAPRAFRAGPTRFQYPTRRSFIGPASVVGTGVMIDIPLTGVINGTNGFDGNATFTMPYSPTYLQVQRNNQFLDHGTQFTYVGAVLTILPGFIPRTGDSLRAQGNV